MTTFLYVAVVLFFASVATANLLVWSQVMAKTDGVQLWLKHNLPGINVLAIAAAMFWLGKISFQVGHIDSYLQETRTEMKSEFARLDNEVYRNDNSLKAQAAITKADLEYVRPRVIREDFEKAIARLNQEIEKLRDENRLLQKQIDALKAELLSEKRKKS